MEFVTVFCIDGADSSPFIWFWSNLFIWTLFIAGAVLFNYLYYKRRRSIRKGIRITITIILAIFVITMICVVTYEPVWQYKKLREIYLNQEYSIVEGYVHVIRKQKNDGSDNGDIIEIQGKKFEINYYGRTPTYKLPIIYGGVLREGVYAKVYYYEDYILRVDIRRGQ